VQFFVGPSPSVGANISVEYSASGDTNGDIVALFTPVSCPQNKCEGVELVLDGRYAWLSMGGINSTASALAFSPPGCAPFSLYTTAGGTPVAPTPSGGASLAINLGKGAVGFSTSPSPSVSSIQVALKAARAKEEALLQSTFGAARAGEGFAVKVRAPRTASLLLTLLAAVYGCWLLLLAAGCWLLAAGCWLLAAAAAAAAATEWLLLAVLFSCLCVWLLLPAGECNVEPHLNAC